MLCIHCQANRVTTTKPYRRRRLGKSSFKTGPLFLHSLTNQVNKHYNSSSITTWDHFVRHCSPHKSVNPFGSQGAWHISWEICKSCKWGTAVLAMSSQKTKGQKHSLKLLQMNKRFAPSLQCSAVSDQRQKHHTAKSQRGIQGRFCPTRIMARGEKPKLLLPYKCPAFGE